MPDACNTYSHAVSVPPAVHEIVAVLFVTASSARAEVSGQACVIPLKVMFPLFCRRNQAAGEVGSEFVESDL